MALKRMKSPAGLLAVTIGLSGVLSAFLINDIVCLTLTPLVLHLARRMKIDPVPHLIALATAANIGSTGTITGNPQNIFIGSHSGIAYLRFAARLLPIAAIGLLLNFAVVALIYRKRLSWGREAERSSADGGNSENNSRRTLRPPHLWLLQKHRGDSCHRGPFLHWVAARIDCLGSGRRVALWPGQARKSLPANRLGPVGHVHRPLHCGSRFSAARRQQVGH